MTSSSGRRRSGPRTTAPPCAQSSKQRFAGIWRNVPDRKKYKLRWHTERGQLLPGVRLDDRDVMFDLMEGRD